MFDHIWTLIFLTLISKRKYRRKFEEVHEKTEFQFLTEKCDLWHWFLVTCLRFSRFHNLIMKQRNSLASKKSLLSEVFTGSSDLNLRENQNNNNNTDFTYNHIFLLFVFLLTLFCSLSYKKIDKKQNFSALDIAESKSKEMSLVSYVTCVDKSLI